MAERQARASDGASAGFTEPVKKQELTFAKVVGANKRVRASADALKERGMWHRFVGAQIISYANPPKRARKEESLEGAFDKLLDRLDELRGHPERVLRE